MSKPKYIPMFDSCFLKISIDFEKKNQRLCITGGYKIVTGGTCLKRQFLKSGLSIKRFLKYFKLYEHTSCVTIY